MARLVCKKTVEFTAFRFVQVCGVRAVIMLVLLVVGSVEPTRAASNLPSPEGPVVLSITGSISKTNNAKSAEFDMAVLEALPVSTMETETPFSKGEYVFTGVQFSDFMSHIGASGTQVELIALNDYRVNADLDQLIEHGAMIAYKRDDAYMSIRDKGPLWIVFPWSDDPGRNWESLNVLSVWLLHEAHFK